MPAEYEDTIIPGLEPTIKRRYNDGSEFTFTGDRALALADTPGAAEWRAQNPEKALQNSYSPFDSPDESHPIAHSIGKFLRGEDREKSFIGRTLDKGLLPGTVMGGALGAGGGALAALLARLFLGDTSVGRWSAVGGALGAILGGYTGHARANAMSKSAATYMDPRNFILEKLQGATDVSIGEKVKLADAVRNLNRADAEKLASLVRAALGFGVGAIIAKFVFGTTSAAGTLFGGLMGAIGTSILANSLKSPAQPTFDFNFRPLSYRDIL